MIELNKNMNIYINKYWLNFIEFYIMWTYMLKNNINLIYIWILDMRRIHHWIHDIVRKLLLFRVTFMNFEGLLNILGSMGKHDSAFMKF